MDGLLRARGPAGAPGPVAAPACGGGAGGSGRAPALPLRPPRRHADRVASHELASPSLLARGQRAVPRATATSAETEALTGPPGGARGPRQGEGGGGKGAGGGKRSRGAVKTAEGLWVDGEPIAHDSAVYR